MEKNYKSRRKKGEWFWRPVVFGKLLVFRKESAKLVPVKVLTPCKQRGSTFCMV